MRTAEFLIEHSHENDDDSLDEKTRRALIERDMERLRQMTSYAMTTDCLRRYILNYFGEKAPACCGHCGNCDADFEEVDMSVEARKMLNDAGFSDMQIMASNSLDEYLVRDLIVQGAQIDSFGIGERLITSKSEPVFGGVYKLAAVENEDGEIIPKIKVSENVEKITTPHFKQVYRLFDNKTGKALGDVLTIHDEVIDPALPYVLFHPIHTWKQRVVTDYTVRPLRQQIFKNGECIYQSPSITEIRDYCMREVDTLWDQIKRFENPQTYFVDLSKKLWSCKNELLEACRI